MDDTVHDAQLQRLDDLAFCLQMFVVFRWNYGFAALTFVLRLSPGSFDCRQSHFLSVIVTRRSLTRVFGERRRTINAAVATASISYMVSRRLISYAIGIHTSTISELAVCTDVHGEREERRLTVDGASRRRLRASVLRLD
jgi:hypothetical protein